MPKLTIRNMTNSPYDLEGGVRLPAMGEVTAVFSEHYASLLRASPGVEVVAASPLDHDSDGKRGGVADPSPLTADEEAELLDAMNDDELRDIIERKTGTRPHPNAKTETLLKKAKEAAGAAD